MNRDINNVIMDYLVSEGYPMATVNTLLVTQ